jgi:hypothetical protein
MVTLLRRIRQFARHVHTVWSIAGITLLAVLLTEAGFRLVFAIKDHFARDEAPDRRVLEAGYGGEAWPIQHFRELKSLQDRWEPYVYFRQKALAGRTITIDAEGLRRTPEAPSPSGNRPARVFRLLMLGGSSLWGYGSRDDRTIPWLVVRALDERGYRVEVRNLAEIGYVSTQEVVALLRELQAGYRPDLVIFYDGVNDTTSALLEGEAGVTTNEQNRRAEFNIRQSPSRLSAALIVKLVQDSASYRFAQSVGRRLGGRSGFEARLPSSARRGALAGEVVRRYRGNLAIVDALGRRFGFDALFYWQPVVFDKVAMTPFEREEAVKFEWTRGFFREVYAAVQGSTELGADPHFHDLSRLFAETQELIFIDYCHTTENANERIAGAIVRDALHILQSADRRTPGGDRGTGIVR